MGSCDINLSYVIEGISGLEHGYKFLQGPGVCVAVSFDSSLKPGNLGSFQEGLSPC